VAEKYKILFVSDHQLSTSGVGTQARFLINGLLMTNKYRFLCFGAAIKHEKYDLTVVSPDFIIQPIDGFGKKDVIRRIMAVERPDALVLFTDPRFFMQYFEIEDEIHQLCPIIYNHLWDNNPYPRYNDVIYESCDLLNCINWPTYDMLRTRFPEREARGEINFVPHALPEDLYKQYTDDQRTAERIKMLGAEKSNDFIALWVGRNARRKRPSDLLIGWNLFLNELERKRGHRKAQLIMHCDPCDPEGPNLYHVLETVGCGKNVIFSKDRVGFDNMVSMYNMCDVGVNVSMAEGFGLPILETMYCGHPVISIKTGGLTRQVVDCETGDEYGVAMDPDLTCMVGNQQTPYIWEDYVSHEHIAQSFMKVYEMGPEGRREVGQRARQYATREYSMKRLLDAWDKTLCATIDGFKKLPPKRWTKITL
jgi:glycosyltransferase involved in cell wall biosynthesis